MIRHTAPDEALLNGVNAYAANLYNPDADYFWFGFHNTVKIAAYWGYGKIDYNPAIKRHKLKILLPVRQCFGCTKTAAGRAMAAVPGKEAEDGGYSGWQ